MNGFVSDIRSYFLKRPTIRTLIDFDSEEDREAYIHRFLHRLDVSVSKYSVLNIHKIGIDAPASYVFEELLEQQEPRPWWPNSVVRLASKNEGLGEIEFLLLGGPRLFGYSIGRLFKATLVRLQDFPEPSNHDNARYLFYECSGGYPVGIFVIYVRSAIEAQGEQEQTQLFSAVGFNFFGRKKWRRSFGIVSRAWESIHNRVTANVLNTFKRICEARCRERLEGLLQERSPADTCTTDRSGS
jgi:hypothetical protein